MLILGRKYKFTKFEKQRLKRKKILTRTIRYTNKNPEEVLDEIKDCLKNKKLKTIVLNTKSKVDDKIIKYLLQPISVQ